MGGDSDVDTASEGVRRRPPMNPRGLLFLFVSASLVTYVDRGAIASNGVNSEGVQQDFGLSDFQDGVLASAFMVGLVIGAPVFAEATKYYDGFSCMFVGLTIWCLALVRAVTGEAPWGRGRNTIRVSRDSPTWLPPCCAELTHVLNRNSLCAKRGPALTTKTISFGAPSRLAMAGWWPHAAWWG